jgi:hypothetical protein
MHGRLIALGNGAPFDGGGKRFCGKSAIQDASSGCAAAWKELEFVGLR